MDSEWFCAKSELGLWGHELKLIKAQSTIMDVRMLFSIIDL